MKTEKICLLLYLLRVQDLKGILTGDMKMYFNHLLAIISKKLQPNVKVWSIYGAFPQAKTYFGKVILLKFVVC